MLLDHKSDKDGWTIEVHCREFRPDGWVPGDRVKYLIMATAELRIPQIYPRGWSSEALLRYPKGGIGAVFDSDSEGHQAAREDLTARIESVKIR